MIGAVSPLQYIIMSIFLQEIRFNTHTKHPQRACRRWPQNPAKCKASVEKQQERPEFMDDSA